MSLATRIRLVSEARDLLAQAHSDLDGEMDEAEREFQEAQDRIDALNEEHAAIRGAEDDLSVLV